MYGVQSDAVGCLLLVGEVVDVDGALHANERRHLVGVGCREQNSALDVGQTLQSLLHFGAESHAQTLVKLVEYEPAYALGVDVELVDMVVESAWSGEHNLGLGAHYQSVFVHCGTTAVQASRAQTAAHALEYLVRLQGQLSARYNHNRLHLVAACIEARGDRQQIGKSLAAAGRSQHHHVLVGVQNGVGCFFLHRIKAVDA